MLNKAKAEEGEEEAKNPDDANDDPKPGPFITGRSGITKTVANTSYIAPTKTTKRDDLHKPIKFDNLYSGIDARGNFRFQITFKY